MPIARSLRLRSVIPAASAGLLCACSIANYYSPPPPGPSLSQGDPIAIYRFSDTRALVDLRAIGSYPGRRRTLYTYDSKPVAITVTEAFIRALKDRGIVVIDMSPAEFTPGRSTIGANLVMAGSIQEFWVARGYGQPTCRIHISLHKLPKDHLLWERVSQKTIVGDAHFFTERRVYESMAVCLQEIVNEVMNDQEFLRQLAGPSTR